MDIYLHIREIVATTITKSSTQTQISLDLSFQTGTILLGFLGFLFLVFFYTLSCVINMQHLNISISS